MLGLYYHSKREIRLGAGGRMGWMNIHVVGLVHDTEDDLGLRSIFRGELRPEADELIVSNGSVALADDLAVPAGVVVDV